MLCIFRFDNHIQVSVTDFPLGFVSECGNLVCECGNLAVQPLFAIGSAIPAQLIAFLKKLFQLGVHPEHLSFSDRLDGEDL